MISVEDGGRVGCYRHVLSLTPFNVKSGCRVVSMIPPTFFPRTYQEYDLMAACMSTPVSITVLFLANDNRRIQNDYRSNKRTIIIIIIIRLSQPVLAIGD
jgi:hypothetical protein